MLLQLTNLSVEGGENMAQVCTTLAFVVYSKALLVLLVCVHSALNFSYCF